MLTFRGVEEGVGHGTTARAAGSEDVGGKAAAHSLQPKQAKTATAVVATSDDDGVGIVQRCWSQLGWELT